MFFTKISSKKGTIIIQSPNKGKYTIIRRFAEAVAKHTKEQIHLRYHSICQGYEQYFFDLLDEGGNAKEYLVVNSIKETPDWYIEHKHEYLNCQSYNGIISQNDGTNKISFSIHFFNVSLPLEMVKEFLFVDQIDEVM
jgi:hypothetical protein